MLGITIVAAIAIITIIYLCHYNKKKSRDVSMQSKCRIINNIKSYYNDMALNSNNFDVKMYKINDANIVKDTFGNLYCDVNYNLNNNINGKRRFGISKEGLVISMGTRNSGVTV